MEIMWKEHRFSITKGGSNGILTKLQLLRLHADNKFHFFKTLLVILAPNGPTSHLIQNGASTVDVTPEAPLDCSEARTGIVMESTHLCGFFEGAFHPTMYASVDFSFCILLRRIPAGTP